MNEGKIKRIPFYDETLLKYPYAGRSFTPQTQEERNREAQIKLLEGGEDYRDKIAVICDDSIVRGTQAKTNLVPKLRKIGIKEIYFRISNPELRSYCPWGKTVQKGETMVSQIPSKEDRIKFLGIESLEYNTIEELVRAIGLPREKLCVDCSLALSD
jgi:amidophosphoribosyltransferase